MEGQEAAALLAPMLHKAQLANAVTSFCTCLAGILPLWFTLTVAMQPARWVFVYACIVITAIPTVAFHAFEQSPTLGSIDTTSNILLTWAMHIAVAGDFCGPKARRWIVGLSSAFNAAMLLVMVYEIANARRITLISFGDSGFYYASEVALIANSLVVTGLFLRYHARIPRRARPLLYTTIFLFGFGAYLSSAANDYVTLRIVAWHASWHVVGGFALLTLWIFNHVRFDRPPSAGSAQHAGA